ncbi:MAG: hypothetical protein U0W40_15865 [Acidimicrobiia bacterium]
MLSGEKILVTGPAGRIAQPLARTLAADNEVWGIARFSEEGSRYIESFGITTRQLDYSTRGVRRPAHRLHVSPALAADQRVRLRPARCA